MESFSPFITSLTWVINYDAVPLDLLVIFPVPRYAFCLGLILINIINEVLMCGILKGFDYVDPPFWLPSD